MREFAQTLSEFHKGLRPDANTPRNSGFATELYNSRCGVAGLEVPPLIAYPISGAPTLSWPLPQLIKIYGLHFADTGLHFVRYSSGTLTISEVNSDYSLTSVFTKASINTRFTIADFGYYQLWSGIGLMIKRQIVAGLTSYAWTEVLIGALAPPVKCVCNFRGQLIAGVYLPAAEAIGGTEDNLVAWSEIGSVDPTVMFDAAQYFIDRQRGTEYTSGTLTLTSAESYDDGFDSYVIGFPASIWRTQSYLIVGETGGVVYNLYIRIPNVTLPPGTVITSAIVRFVSYETAYGAGAKSKCYFNDVDNAVAPTTGAGVEALALTAAVDWPATVQWAAGSTYDTPDLTTILQAIIDRAGWASGQAVMIVIRDDSSPTGHTRAPRSWNYGGASVPQLIITYTNALTSIVRKPYKRTSGNYRTGPTSTVHRVIPLGNGVMVYCADKIFYMKAASVPEPTFGIVPIASFGIPSTFCAEGDEDEHLFVSSNKEIWRVKDGPKLERLGYKEYMDLLTGTIVISRNPNFGDYYISNGSKTYLLSQYGLSQWFQYPTSLVWEDANKRLIGPIAVSADVSAYMASDIYDFGVRALKTITTMEIGATGQVMTANIDYKYKVTDSVFTASRLKTASNFGTVTPLVSGIEFKMRVKGADYTKFDLDYLTVRYKYVDKRMIRGVYATDAKVLSRSGR